MVLKQVDLPAPFGPISARNSPAATVEAHVVDRAHARRSFCAATMTASPLMTRAGARSSRRNDADDAGGKRQHQHQNDAAEQRVPIFGLPHDEVLQHRENTERRRSGRTSVWMPPSSTMTRPSIERPMLMVSGEIEPLAKAKMPPATPHTVPAMAKASQCTRLTLMPIASARSGESRPARMA